MLQHSPSNLAEVAARESRLEQALVGRTVLILPGWHGSGLDHWQTLWERKYSSLKRVEQHSWTEPLPYQWLDRISEMVREAALPIFMVAHSLACIAVSRWANAEPGLARLIEAALLVTPADVSDPARCPEVLRRFAPIPLSRLPFASSIIGSLNDPYMSAASAERLAHVWGSDFINAGYVGHINSASGHGSWPEGEDYLADLLRR
jgi:uncharacterized protein